MVSEKPLKIVDCLLPLLEGTDIQQHRDRKFRKVVNMDAISNFDMMI